MTQTTEAVKVDAGNDDGANQQLPTTKEKLKTIMEAASALTALGDEESESSRPTSPSKAAAVKEETEVVVAKEIAEASPPLSKEQQDAEDEAAAANAKRFLPEHKKPDAAPTFPEKLMALMRFADEQKDNKSFCAAWLPEGKSFVIRNPDEFARQVVPKFFKATKFSSFTRKLYRWGFRQINRGIGPDDPIIFGNEFFDRDNEELMSKMRSVTAAGTRKTETRGSAYGGKRSFDGMYDVPGGDQKRFLFDHLMQHKNNGNMNMMHQNGPPHYGNMNANSLHPGGMGVMDQGHHQQMMGMNKSYEMMPQGGPAASMMNHQYNPMPMHHQQQGMVVPNGGQGYGGNNQSTAEIVNAAIRALQFSS